MAGASEETGVTPSNNDLESFWRSLKETMLTDRRVGHHKLLEYVFPQMLFLLEPDYTGPAHRRGENIDRGSLLGAAAILGGSTQPVHQKSYGRWLVNQSATKEVSVLGLLTADC